MSVQGVTALIVAITGLLAGITALIKVIRLGKRVPR